MAEPLYLPPADPKRDLPRAASITSAVVQGDTVALQMCSDELQGGGPIVEIRLSPQAAEALSVRLHWLAEHAGGNIGNTSLH